MDYYRLDTNLSDFKNKIVKSFLFFEFSRVLISPYKFIVNRSPISELLKKKKNFSPQWIIIIYTPIYQIEKKILKSSLLFEFLGVLIFPYGEVFLAVPIWGIDLRYLQNEKVLK